MQLNTSLLKAYDLRISMDGQGSWRENKRSAVSRADRREGEARHNVFVERQWKSVQYEEGYLKAYDRVANAKAHWPRICTSTTSDDPLAPSMAAHRTRLTSRYSRPPSDRRRKA